jgi:hypothetical protein
MAIYKTTSSKVIVRKVFRDLKPNNAEWIDDAIEWIGEALEHIGASTQLETKKVVLDVKEYKAILPSDLYYINMVATGGGVNSSVSTKLSELKEELALLNATLSANPNQVLYAQLRDITARVIVLQAEYFKYPEQLTPLAYGTTTFLKDIHCSKCVNEFATASDWYVVENGYIKTSFLEGELCLSYKAFPTDEDCYPLVPDDISFKEAMFWYIYKKLLLGGFSKPSNKIDYGFADQKWSYYCSQARNTANYPDIARYSSFMNQWVRLIPSINHHESDFSELNEREILDRN